jgi:hypothetical protein
MSGRALNMHNKLNAALGLMHLQYNAQQEKKIQIFFYYIRTMINVISIFLTKYFFNKKCDVLFRILPSTQRSRFNPFPNFFFFNKQNGQKNP